MSSLFYETRKVDSFKLYFTNNTLGASGQLLFFTLHFFLHLIQDNTSSRRKMTNKKN